MIWYIISEHPPFLVVISCHAGQDLYWPSLRTCTECWLWKRRPDSEFDDLRSPRAYILYLAASSRYLVQWLFPRIANESKWMVGPKRSGTYWLISTLLKYYYPLPSICNLLRSGMRWAPCGSAVCFIKVDSAHLGSPAMRRRIYFILVRRHDLFFESEALQQKHAFLQLIGISLNHMTCTRDVACATIKDHCQLEAHCNQVYQKLKLNFVTHLGPPASYVWLPKNSPSIRDRSVAPEVRPAPSRWLPIPPGRSEGFGC